MLATGQPLNGTNKIILGTLRSSSLFALDEPESQKLIFPLFLALTRRLIMNLNNDQEPRPTSLFIPVPLRIPSFMSNRLAPSQIYFRHPSWILRRRPPSLLPCRLTPCQARLWATKRQRTIEFTGRRHLLRDLYILFRMSLKF